MTSSLARIIRDAFPFTVSVATANKVLDNYTLHPDEFVAVQAAVDSRQAEFATGRHLAKCALAELGVEVTKIPVRANRAPEWPPGIVGSITHCDGLFAAVVARAHDTIGIGLDAERLHAVDQSLYTTLFTDDEQRWLRKQPSELATVLFSAKETVHKTTNEQLATMFDFQDVAIHITADGFRATLSNANRWPPAHVKCLQGLRGYVLRTEAHVFTAAHLVGTLD